MPRRTITEEIKELLRRGHIEEAIQEGCDYTKNNKRKYNKYFNALSAQYQIWNKNRLMGLGTNREELNRIIMGINSTAEELEDAPTKERRSKKNYSNVQQGVIITLQQKKNYGFIKVDSSAYKDNVFFHFSSLKRGHKNPKKGQRVSFQTTQDGNRLKAVNISLHNHPGVAHRLGQATASSFVELYNIIKRGLNGS